MRVGRGMKSLLNAGTLKYKQLALADTSLELDSYFAIYSPTAKGPQVYRQLLFH